MAPAVPKSRYTNSGRPISWRHQRRPLGTIRSGAKPRKPRLWSTERPGGAGWPLRRALPAVVVAVIVSCGGTLAGVKLAGGNWAGSGHGPEHAGLQAAGTAANEGAKAGAFGHLPKGHSTATSQGASATPPQTRPNVPPEMVRVPAVAGVKVTGTFGSPPTVAVSGSPPARPQVAIVVRGPGQPLRAGDLAIADDYGRTWKNGKVFENTYILGVPPDAFPVGSNALGRGLEGIPVGSRVVIVVPPAEGFGVSAALPKGVNHNDTALLVVDLVGSYKPDQGPSGSFRSFGGGSLPIVSGPLDAQPMVKVPHGAAPKALVVKTLIEGNGPPIERQQLVITQYVGVNWRTGAVFGSSWQNHVPTAYLLGSAEAIPAWEDALPGVRIGSRVMMVVPPADGYGSKGNAKAGIKGTDTLVFVVDVLGSYGT